MRKYLYGKWLEDEVIDTPPQAPVQSIKRTSHPSKIVYSSGASVMFDGSQPVEVHLPSVDDVETKATKEYKTMVLNNEITELQKYLTGTDYIITKLNEAKLEDDAEFEAMKAQYSEQLTKRKEARFKINELQKQLEEINR